MAATTISAASGLTKKASDQIPYCRDQGMPYLAGAAVAGMTVQSKQVIQVGAAPFSVGLEAVGMARMANTDYTVIVQGETAGQPMVDQSTITVNGFDVLGGANTEVLHITVTGRIDGQLNGD